MKGEDGLLATYKFDDVSTTRAELKIRAVEGPGGDLFCYVLPMYEPKISKMVEFSIKPLCLHEKVAVLGSSAPEGPMNELTVEGNFSVSDIHGWVCQMLPEIPPHVTEDTIQMNFIN
jgi:Bardet-Biedl syndrome 7 protein